MPDYSKLIDAETWAFIERTNSFYPENAVEMTIAGHRAVYDAMCRAFHAAYPDGVTATDLVIDATAPVRARRYRRADVDPAALVIYYHGGGFTLGGLESHDSICAEICGRTGFDVVSTDYRLAPEHLHPAAFEDALAAFAWASKTFAYRVILVGDSAGGNLAAAVSAAARGRRRQPDGQVLIYPGLGGDWRAGSYVEHAQAPLLTVKDIAHYRGVRTGGVDRADDMTIWPLADRDFAGLPPTFIAAAECDPLCSDAEAYGSRILAAGGRAAWVVDHGLVHGHLRARHSVLRAAASFARIVDAIAALGHGRWVW